MHDRRVVKDQKLTFRQKILSNLFTTAQLARKVLSLPLKILKLVLTRKMVNGMELSLSRDQQWEKVEAKLVGKQMDSVFIWVI